MFVLVRPSQHKSGHWAKKQQQKTNKTKPTTTKKHTKNWCSSGLFFFFFFFKVFIECAFYAQRASPTNKTTSVNTASFNSFFFEKQYSNDMFPFCQPERAASIKNKNSLVSLREEISTSTFFELSNGCRNNAREILSQLRSAPTEKVYKNKSWKLDGVFSIICFCSTLSFLQ